MKNALISGAADVLTGLAALVLFVLADVFLHVGADLRVALFVLAVLFLCAGLLRGRGRPGNPWWKGILISSGSGLALLVLTWGEIQPAILATLLLTGTLFVICGVHMRRLWSAQSVARAGTPLVAALAALGVVALAAIPALTTRVATRLTSSPAPAFSLTTPDGAVVSSADLRGRVVVLDFWATWCPVCRRELPELDKIYQRYRGNASVSFWAADGLKNGDTAEQAVSFMRNAGYTLPVAFYKESLPQAFGLEGLPSLIVVDRSGRIRLVHTGYDRSEHLEAELSSEIDGLLGRL